MAFLRHEPAPTPGWFSTPLVRPRCCENLQGLLPLPSLLTCRDRCTETDHVRTHLEPGCDFTTNPEWCLRLLLIQLGGF